MARSFGSMLLMLLALAACAKYPDSDPTTLSQHSANNLPAVNYWKTPAPAIICGTSGYTFILSEYLRPQCGACHGANGLAMPYFTSTDPTAAYNAALTINKDLMLTRVTSNTFCGPECNLSPSGDVYQGIVNWENNRTACPAP